jgi:hypothetical protein
MKCCYEKGTSRDQERALRNLKKKPFHIVTIKNSKERLENNMS